MVEVLRKKRKSLRENMNQLRLKQQMKIMTINSKQTRGSMEQFLEYSRKIRPN